MSSNAHEPPKSAAVVIIGGGVIGTAIAYFLAGAGVEVCLLERRDIGAGTTSAAAAAALLQTKTSAKKLALASRSLALLDELAEQLDHCFEYEHSGSLLVANSEAEMDVVKNMAVTLQTLGLDVQWVAGDEARSMMPVLGPTIIGASYSPRDATINPLKLVLAYADAARRMGAKICTFTAVTGIETVGDRILAVLTHKGRIYTDTVVNAAGVWAPQLARLVGLDLPVAPLKGELLVTEPMPPMMRGTLIAAKYLLSKAQLEQTDGGETPKRSAGITLVQVERGNFIVGSTREQAGFDRRSTYAGIREVSWQLLELTPALANVHLIRAYAGLRPITPDGLPIIGRAPELPGFIMAAGYGGDGLVLSAVTAEIISTIMLKGTVAPDTLAPFSYDRFTTS
ncbi:MAG: FAD-dependent oxidoreductase [Chloroflexota bacterium]